MTAMQRLKDCREEPILLVRQNEQNRERFLFSPRPEEEDIATPLRRPHRKLRSKRLHAERDFLVLSYEDHPMLSAAREKPRKETTVTSLTDLWESMTQMCAPAFACAAPSGSSMEDFISGSVASKNVYPVERYADFPALNAAHLLRERQEDQQHKLFRPVSEDSSCMQRQLA